MWRCCRGPLPGGRGGVLLGASGHPDPRNCHHDNGETQRCCAPNPVNPRRPGPGWFQDRAHLPTLRVRPPVLWQHAPDMPASVLLEPVLRWYAQHARSLPWRRSGTSPWQVLVSEVMLQQTPVVRVLAVYDAWVRRWPTPAGLATDGPGEALRMWRGLGYPRRALRLHETATILVRDYGGRVPSSYQQLLTLPGIGDYTAAAVAAFAYGERTVVLDTNVRRVLARAVSGQEHPPRAVRTAERGLALELLP
jgi:adenine-specific DNA glycosylase